MNVWNILQEYVKTQCLSWNLDVVSFCSVDGTRWPLALEKRYCRLQYVMIYDMIYLTAVGLTPGCSSAWNADGSGMSAFTFKCISLAYFALDHHKSNCSTLLKVRWWNVVYWIPEWERNVNESDTLFLHIQETRVYIFVTRSLCWLRVFIVLCIRSDTFWRKISCWATTTSVHTPFISLLTDYRAIRCPRMWAIRIVVKQNWSNAVSLYWVLKV
jgi:hypothetical protein